METKLLDRSSELVDRLMDADPAVRIRAADAVRGLVRPGAPCDPGLGTPLSRPSSPPWGREGGDLRASILNQLADRLTDVSPGVRQGAAFAVSALGSAASTSVIIDRLAELLWEDVPWVCQAAIEALCVLGPSAI